MQLTRHKINFSPALAPSSYIDSAKLSSINMEKSFLCKVLFPGSLPRSRFCGGNMTPLKMTAWEAICPGDRVSSEKKTRECDIKFHSTQNLHNSQLWNHKPNKSLSLLKWAEYWKTTSNSVQVCFFFSNERYFHSWKRNFLSRRCSFSEVEKQVLN